VQTAGEQKERGGVDEREVTYLLVPEMKAEVERCRNYSRGKAWLDKMAYRKCKTATLAILHRFQHLGIQFLRIEDDIAEPAATIHGIQVMILSDFSKLCLAQRRRTFSATRLLPPFE
jgi:hypothetical protein